MSRRMTQASRKLLTWIPMGAVAAATACAPQSREIIAPQPDRVVAPAEVAPAEVAGDTPYTSGDKDPSRAADSSRGAAGPTRFVNAHERIQLAGYQLGESARQTGGEVEDSAQRARAQEQARAQARREAARARREAAQARREAAQARRRVGQSRRAAGQARANKGGQLLASSDTAAAQGAEPVKLVCGMGNSKRPSYCNNSGAKK